MNKSLIDTARAFLMNAGLNSKQIFKLEASGYFIAPASMRHHLNRPQGLIEHSINVTRQMLDLNVFKDRDSCYRVGMLHDLVKCFCYREKDGKDGKVIYSYQQPIYPGHGLASALFAAEFGIELTAAERSAIIWHMGTYGLDENALREFSRAKLRFPREVILTHAADDLAASIETFNAHNENPDIDEMEVK